MVKIGSVELCEFPLVLAPMEEITDPPFRLICKKYGADLLYTEFISSEAIIRNISRSLKKAVFSEEERPIAIQVFGHDEDSLKRAAECVSGLKPDIIDINFGCPVQKVVSRGAGAGALKDIRKMINLTKAVVRSTNLPVTVKTRLGWDEKSICITELAEQLQDTGIKAMAIHARTARQKYQGKADWTWIGKTLENPRLHIPVFGNGDIDSPEAALMIKNKYPVSGLMIGRAAIGNPWLFKQIHHLLEFNELIPSPTIHEIIETCKEHLLAASQWKDERYAIMEHRKHYRNYFKGLMNFRPFRARLMEATEKEEVMKIFEDIREYYTQ